MMAFLWHLSLFKPFFFLFPPSLPPNATADLSLLPSPVAPYGSPAAPRLPNVFLRLKPKVKFL